MGDASQSRVTPRLDQISRQGEHALQAAVDQLRRERAAEDKHRREQSEFQHRDTRTRFNDLEEATANAFKDLRADLKENTDLAREQLMAIAKLGSRLEVVEKALGDEKNGLIGKVATLETDRTRAIQTIGLFTAICGIIWVIWGDEIRARGLLNRSEVELTRMVDAVIERRVQPTAIKPNP